MCLTQGTAKANRMLVDTSGAPVTEQNEWIIELVFLNRLSKIVNQGGTTGTLLVLVLRTRRVLFLLLERQ